MEIRDCRSLETSHAGIDRTHAKQHDAKWSLVSRRPLAGQVDLNLIDGPDPPCDPTCASSPQ
jgi:hypothetical protein